MKSKLATSILIAFLALPFFSKSSDAETLPANLSALLTKHCVNCHGPDEQEGGFRIDTLHSDVATGDDADRWHEALNRINAGEMPPDGEPKLTDKQFAELTDWLARQLEVAAKSRRQSNGQIVFRRLNRDEYNNTLNDLFGIELDIKDLLPPERTSEDGFTNNGAELVMSPLHFESFLKIARLYFEKALVDERAGRPDRAGFEIEFERDRNGKPIAVGESLGKNSKRIRLSVGTYPGIDPKKKRRGTFDGEIREHSVVLPPARRATGTQIPARRGPQPRIEIPLKEFPDSGIVRVRVQARTLPGAIRQAGAVQVEVYDLLADCNLRSFAERSPLRVLSAADFNLRDLGISIEKVSLKFTTMVDVPTSGKYQFFAKADDGARLYIDNQQIVDAEQVNRESSGSIELTAGLHRLTVTYHDTGGNENLSVQWQGPGIEKQDLPADVLASVSRSKQGDAPIEVNVYPLLPNTSLSSYAGLSPLDTLYTSDLDIHSLGIEIEKISLRFRTMLTILVPGTYKFHTRADDGSTIYIDGKEVANNKHGSGSTKLDAGPHELIVTYHDTGGGEKLTVQWEGPNQKRGSISPDSLSRPEPEKQTEPTTQPEAPVAYLAVMMANRLDDGVEFEPIGQSVAVRATEEPQTYEFVGRMENLPLPFRERTGVSGDLTDARLFLLNRWEPAYASGPRLEIISVEFEAPVYDQWPPKSHTRIVNSDHPKTLTENFLSRAYRRPPTDEETQRILQLWELYANENPESSFVDTVSAVLPAALINPSFLYLVEPTEPERQDSARRQLSDHELANRLSYFLIRTMPDERLRQLADAGEISNAKTIRQETRRLLGDPRSDRFIAGFVDQWLDLDALERIPVDRKRHATYQPWLRDSMRMETRGLFATVMREGKSALDLIESDYLYINPILASHYGIAGVRGTEFRSVPVPKGSHRGGLLTQASFLTGNSNGVDSHPIKRGVWLLDRLLNDPPPPPPPNVPDLDAEDPNFKGKTLKEQLAIHRDVQACRNCHQQIDPFGLPFENFNTVGQWRGSENTKTTLPDGTKINGIDDLKRYLVKDRRADFAQALTRKLFAWALGRSLSFADDNEVKSITGEFQKSGYRIIPLIESIVTSDSFTHR